MSDPDPRPPEEERADNKPPDNGFSTDDTTEILIPFDDQGRPIPTAESPKDKGPHYQLMVRTGAQAGRSWSLPRGHSRVGRLPYNDITLDHITVSRRHCRITVTTEGVSLTDLGSTNGTYVNGSLAERSLLIDGDELMIGTFRLLLVQRQ
ncbi:MAG: FHA domain-containing protein [Acidimicrobiia bacterium]|nr:FHA domain-containing protein [bacterium]MXX63678.1 FHA domain-containing protein [Acidimicrobiia bacterium]MCY3652152.1 FHA domain-containing protein [bacterium]MDE0643397.1 FHA domain-containing protein [bacterium]MXZ07297.1 FHA domain-containing protein [Acidimicrobiia bacterium]